MMDFPGHTKGAPGNLEGRTMGKGGTLRRGRADPRAY